VKAVAIGLRGVHRVATTPGDSAEAFGNPGVRVVGTPALIGFLETAAHRCLETAYEPGEGSVGTHVDVRHLAAAPDGAEIESTAEVIRVAGRRVRFAVAARWGETLVMEGTHERAVVDLARFLAKVQPRP
jgi:predicted thioesterase